MNKVVLVIAVLLSLNSMAQKKVVFYDVLFDEPVSNVQVFNRNSEFIGLSNESGGLVLRDNDFPIDVKRGGFQLLKVEGFMDTVVLTPKFQEISGVDIKPVNKIELYREIIKFSSQLVDKSSVRLNGIYFESMLMIDAKNQDTIRVDKLCDMSIYKAGSKKKIAYTLYCDDAKKNYSFSGTGSGELSDLSSDTSKVGNLLKIIPEFNKNLEYDLIKTKKYDLDFEESEIKRSVGEPMSRLVFDDDAEYKKHVVVDYEGRKLHSWVKNVTRDRTYDGKGIYINFTKSEHQIEFETEVLYGFSTIIDNAKIDLGTDGVLYEIYLVKGFIQDDSVVVDSNAEVKKMIDYFKSVENSNELARFYTFEF
ncbi:MAG: hypothetical protein MK105_10370 [Crocinitomicaceae bacterium]|nr:hypothetical protein [Crocinitomicaceae bacterium]